MTTGYLSTWQAWRAFIRYLAPKRILESLGKHLRVSRQELAILFVVLGGSITQCVYAIYHYGYVGQDFNQHVGMILEYGQRFSYGHSDPPLLYLLGFGALRLLGREYFLEALSFFFVLLNSASLILVFRFLDFFTSNKTLKWCAFLMIVFLPARLITSTVIAADALIVLPFFLLAHFTLRLWEGGTGEKNLYHWFGATVCLCIGIYAKYTFFSLAITLLIIFIPRYLKKPEEMAWLGFAMLLIPIAQFCFEMNESHKSQSVITHVQWNEKGAPSAMNLGDILLPKIRDLKLLRAPQYFIDPILKDHEHSYVGLLHMSTFTDTLNFWQPLNPPISKEHPRYLRAKKRTKITEMANAFLVKFSIPLTFLSVFGSLLALAPSLRAVFSLRVENPETDITDDQSRRALFLALGVGFYVPQLILFPFLKHAYWWGYWLPRLTLPSIFVFGMFGAAFFSKMVQTIKKGRLIEIAYTSIFILLSLFAL